MFTVDSSMQLSGRTTWFVRGPDGMPVCECASPVWASVVANSLRRDLVIRDKLAALKAVIATIEQEEA